MRRLPAVLLLLGLCLCLAGCSALFPPEPPAPAWTTGFWFWQGSSADAKAPGEPVDVLYVHAGKITTERMVRFPGEVAVDAWWPANVPPAREYWLVFRYDELGVPPRIWLEPLAAAIAKVRAEAVKTGHPIVGVQLDIDSPTAALPQYAAFLRELKPKLPPGSKVSITALLDWFRRGTAISEVIREVDEFVPQFYDTNPGYDLQAPSIAAKVDAARWGPVFNAFGKPFRIGVSTFGRAYRWSDGTQAYGDLRPLDVAVNPDFHMKSSRNEAGETLVVYRAERATMVGYDRLDPGDGFRFVLPTTETVRAAVESARQMRGQVAGVVFFRWPSSGESLALEPEEALAAAGVQGRKQPGGARLALADGQCAAVACVDVYLEGAAPLSPQARHYRFRSSRALAYFLPADEMPIRMSGRSELALSLPPYCARGRMYLGRAVAAERPEFTIEEAQ